MGSFGGFLALAYIACVIGAVLYVLSLLGRFVRCHERVAAALEAIARKTQDDSRR